MSNKSEQYPYGDKLYWDFLKQVFPTIKLNYGNKNIRKYYKYKPKPLGMSDEEYDELVKKAIQKSYENLGYNCKGTDEECRIGNPEHEKCSRCKLEQFERWKKELGTPPKNIFKKPITSSTYDEEVIIKNGKVVLNKIKETINGKPIIDEEIEDDVIIRYQLPDVVSLAQRKTKIISIE